MNTGIPSDVIWSSCASALVLAIGLAALALRGDWRRARGLDVLILLGPLFYAAPLAGFGVEHFTLTGAIASLVPKWIPWHRFWTYVVGAGFIAAGFSLATRIQARLAASLVAATFFLFVVLMDAPGWLRQPGNRIALALTLRELSFGAGALAFAASLPLWPRARDAGVFATIARYCVAVAALDYGLQQFLHPDHVPGVPLARLTPAYVSGHVAWTYAAAAAYGVTGALLLVGKKTRTAATVLGATVLAVEVAVYLPIGIVERASLANGYNYVADTLMFCGAVFMLAGALPSDS